MGRLVVLLGIVMAGCTRPNPLACADGSCSDPAYPFCDVDGSLSGTEYTCIAVDCAPMEFIACRGSTVITCNATGNNYDLTQCELGCDAASGCAQPPRIMYILFVSDRDGNQEIYRMNPDGSLPTNLTSSLGSDVSPSWDPTGERISFLSDRTGTYQLYTMNADGSDVVNVSLGQAADSAWSADGSLLAFSSNRSGTPQIYKTLRATASITPLTSLTQAVTQRPSWSPDGSRIAFESGAGTTQTFIYVMNADGGGVAPVSAGSLRGDRTPAWHPNGSKIAFSRGVSFNGHDIFVMNADGSDAIPVTNTASDTLERSAVWSPDGSHLTGVIIHAVTGMPTSGTGVFVTGDDGTNFQYIVLPPGDLPCWSPDGSLVAYEANGDIYTVPATGGSKSTLTTSAAQDTQCAWRPR